LIRIAFSFITPIPATLTGLSSYADSLIAAFAERNSNRTIEFITNANPAIFEHINKTSTGNVKIIRLGGGRWINFKTWSIRAHIRASLMARRIGIDCLVSVTPVGSLIPFVDQLIIVHDVHDFDRQHKSFYHVLFSKILRHLSIRTSKGVICVSDTTLSDTIAELKSASPKFHVIKEASKYRPLSSDVARDEQPRSRFLFVANIERTKNAVCLLEALRRAQNRGLRIQVDWIGRDTSDIVGGWIRENGSLENFVPRGFVTDEELGNAYRDSIALVVPSLREGFCLPVLEAHSFGTPVIGSDIPILREVVGAGGIFFKTTDPDALLDALNLLSNDTALQRSLRQKALDNARLYSWDRSAEQLERFAAKCCAVDEHS
jgi:glycosyltransferase involved in cell wall biosynthesis